MSESVKRLDSQKLLSFASEKELEKMKKYFTRFEKSSFYKYIFELKKEENLNILGFLKDALLEYRANEQRNGIDTLNSMLNNHAGEELQRRVNFAPGQLPNNEMLMIPQIAKYFNEQLRKLRQSQNVSNPMQFLIESIWNDIMNDKKNKKINDSNEEYPYKLRLYYFLVVEEYTKISVSKFLSENHINVELSIVVTFRSELSKGAFDQIFEQLIEHINEENEGSEQQQQNYLKGSFQEQKVLLIKLIFARFISFRHTSKQQSFFKKCPLDLTKFEPVLPNPEDTKLVTYQNDYLLLPDDIGIELKKKINSKEEYLKAITLVIERSEYDRIEYLEISEKTNDIYSQDSNKMNNLNYFIFYFYYWNNLLKPLKDYPYAFVDEKNLEKAKRVMKQTIFGIEKFLENSQMNSMLKEFQNPSFLTQCKGPLIYGPPGTGKTFIIQELITNLNLHMIFEGNSSNFQQSLVGEGSRLLQIYFNRAVAIPWYYILFLFLKNYFLNNISYFGQCLRSLKLFLKRQPCAIHIGEIEQLVVKKDGDKGGGSSEVLNLLLELTDGSQTVPNVKIFSTTNHLDMIEEAMLSRFRHIYLGKSNSALRSDFIVWFFLQIKAKSKLQFKKKMEIFFTNDIPKESLNNNTINSNHNNNNKNYSLQYFLEQKEDQQIKLLKEQLKVLVQQSINFSTRQLMALLGQITSSDIKKSDPLEKLNQKIIEFCKNQDLGGFSFGKDLLPSLIFRSSISKKKLTSDLQKFVDIAQDKVIPDSKEDTNQLLNSQFISDEEVKLLQESNFEYSKSVLIDLSTTNSDERINVLLQKTKSAENSKTYLKLQKLYSLLIIYVNSILKCEHMLSYLNKIKHYTFQKKFSRQDSSHEENLLNKKKKSSEKTDNTPKEDSTFIRFVKEDICKYVENEQLAVQQYLQNIKSSKFNSKELLLSLKHLHSKLQEKPNNTITKEVKSDTYSDESIIEEYKRILTQSAGNISEIFQRAFNHEELQNIRLENLLYNDTVYKLEFFTLDHTENDNLLVALIEFIKQGDFSKVDMVDFHGCEHKNANRSVEDFKKYLDCLISEGRNEEKALIVYKLDDILNVNEAEDQQLDEQQRQKATKIFQNLVKHSDSTNMWQIFVTKNFNVIDQFYSNVYFWPRTSEQGQRIKSMQNMLKLVKCVFCNRNFKEGDEEDKCKAHFSNSFFKETNIHKYKKFEDEWTNCVTEYYRRKAHYRDHAIRKIEVKGCPYCDQNKEVGVCDKEIDDLNLQNFEYFKCLNILPEQYRNYNDLIILNQPVPLEIIESQIDDGLLYAHQVKRACCQGDYYKEECVPHKHQKEMQQSSLSEADKYINNLVIKK